MTGLVLLPIQQITGRNPVEELVQFVSGDWESFSRCADVWRRVGNVIEDIAYNIDHGNASMDHGWEGAASEVAYRHFAQLADALMGLRARFEQLADGYEQYAKWCYMITSVLADALKALLDFVLQLLTRKRGWGIPVLSEAFTVFYSVKIVKLVVQFGYMVIAARGTAGAYFLKLAFVDEDLMGAGPVLKSKSYDMAGVN